MLSPATEHTLIVVRRGACRLQKQLSDFQAELGQRRQIQADSKVASAREQRLVSAAFYELGLEYMQ